MKTGDKVRHKSRGLIDGVIYEGNDYKTGQLMTFVRIKEDFENNFELCDTK